MVVKKFFVELVKNVFELFFFLLFFLFREVSKVVVVFDVVVRFGIYLC